MSQSPLNATLQLKAGDRRQWGRLLGSAASLAIANTARNLSQPLLWITRDTASARQIEQELRFFAADLDVLHLPDWETLPYDSFSPHQDIISERLTTLYRLPDFKRGVLVVPIMTLMHRLPPPAYLQGNSLMLDKGATLDIEQLRQRLATAGYRAVTTVYEHGEFAQRGSLLDIFPMGSELPFRIDLLADEIDSLRTFDTETQRTLDQVDRIRLLPGREFPLTPEAIKAFRERWHEQFDVDHRRCPVYQDVSQGIAPAGIEYYLPLFFDQCASLFDYLPTQSIIVVDNNLPAAAQAFWSEANERYEQRRHNIERPILPPQKIFETVEQVFGRVKAHQQISVDSAAIEPGAGRTQFNTAPPPTLPIDAKAADSIAALRDFTAQQRRVLLCVESPGRRETLLELLARHRLKPKAVDSWNAFIADKNALAITVAPIDRGLLLPDDQLALITESQLFGQRVLQTRRRKRQSEIAENAVRNLSELRIGAPVVHIDHGVGRYCGLQTLTIDDQQAEFVALEYAEGAKLYVPVASLHLIGRYSGAEGDNTPLHRLGSEQWQKAKRKAAEQIRDVAAELLDIYARRAAR
ncbi:MAG TPA: CarD family transcriptional regulator, partial [Spongiibacteraceae bacterium]